MARSHGRGFPEETVRALTWPPTRGEGGRAERAIPLCAELSQHKLHTYKPPFQAHLTKGDLTRTLSSIFLSEERRKSQTKQTRHPRGAFLVVEDAKGSPLYPLDLLSHRLDHRLHHPFTAMYCSGRMGSEIAGKFTSLRAKCSRVWWPLAPRGLCSTTPSAPPSPHMPPHTRRAPFTVDAQS